MYKMSLPESLRAARQHFGLSGVKVADALGMSAAAYRRYERGEVVPSAQVILELSNILGCSPTALMTTGGKETAQQNRTNIQQVDLTLEDGDTMTIVINASVNSSAKVTKIIEPYEPYAEPSTVKEAAKKKA